MEIILGTLIGSGATADVYVYTDNTVIKLYHENYPASNAEWEFKKTQNAWENGMPAPQVFQLVEHHGRYGIVMERIAGSSLSSLLENTIKSLTDSDLSYFEILNTSLFIKFTKTIAHTLFELHCNKANLIETAESSMKNGIMYNSYLTEGEKKLISSMVDLLPKGNVVCHGDPNLNNIIENRSKYFLIDWVNCVTGDPLYDIAEYVHSIQYSKLHPDLHPRIAGFIDECGDFLIETFIAEYKSLSNIDVSTIDDWTIPMLAAKLSGSGNEQYKARLLNEVRILLHKV